MGSAAAGWGRREPRLLFPSFSSPASCLHPGGEEGTGLGLGLGLGGAGAALGPAGHWGQLQEGAWSRLGAWLQTEGRGFKKGAWPHQGVGPPEVFPRCAVTVWAWLALRGRGFPAGFSSGHQGAPARPAAPVSDRRAAQPERPLRRDWRPTNGVRRSPPVARRDWTRAAV